MRYYKKEHTIKLSLMGLFPHRIDDETLLSQIKESYEAEGLDYNAEAQRLEKMQEESFLEEGFTFRVCT